MAELVQNLDAQELYDRACTELFEGIKRVDAPKVVIALPGGRSIKPLLLAMVSRAEELPLECWNRLEIFMLDERVVPLSDAESNFNLVSTSLHQLVEELILRERQLHPFTYEVGKVEESVASYTDKLHEFGGRFHIACLGVGEDAHVAALFPEHSALKSNEVSYLLLSDSPKPPASRITASPALIAKSDLLLGFFIGEAKKEALGKFLSEDFELERCPVKVLNHSSASFAFTNLEL